MQENEIEFEIVENKEASQFDAVNRTGEHIGEVKYQDRGSYLDVYHTGVDEAFEGKGLASKMVRKTLEYIRNQNRQIYPRCPYLASFINRNEEFKDLIFS